MMLPTKMEPLEEDAEAVELFSSSDDFETEELRVADELVQFVGLAAGRFGLAG
jgi:hypothetical protein